MITDINQIDLNKTYTYADYLSWQIKERVELLWGKVMKMTPSPSLNHQKVSSALHREIAVFLKEKPCQVFHAPFDVRLITLSENKEEKISVVQPDIVIVCDSNKLDEKGCNGTPDLIIEILSPSSATKDLKHKFKLYEEAGISEYWIVDPHDGMVQVFVMGKNNKYKVNKPYAPEDLIISSSVKGLAVDLRDIFPDILKEPEEPYGENVQRI